MSFYSIGVSALNAAQVGLMTTGQNISNANTAGYHRQITIQGTNTPLNTGSGFIGQGVSVTTVSRVYSQFLDTQLQQAQSQASNLTAYQSAISQVDNLLSNSSVGLSPSLQSFFSAVSSVAANPQLISARQSMLSSGSALASSFQTLNQQFTDIRSGLNTQISQNVSSINSYAQQIATLNQQIVALTSNPSQPPNDLLDQRDNLVSQMNQLVKTTVVQQSDGSYNLFIGNGQPLVVGQQTFNLTAIASPQDPTEMEVGYKSGSSTSILPDGSITGGTLGGLLSFRQQTLDPAQNALGRIAMVMAQTVNTQQGLGQDLNGASGQPIFTQPQPNVIASSNNTGTGTLTGTLTNASALTTSDYQITVSGTSPNAYQVTDLSTNITTSYTDATLPNAIPGVALSLGTGWAPATGDVFVVQPTRLGAQSFAVSPTMTAAGIAAASPVVTNAAATNQGTGQVAGSTVTSTPLPALPITLTYNSTTNQFSYGSPAVNVNYTAGAPMTISGNIQVTISGNPANGDQFVIGPNTGGVSDNSNALLMGNLQTTNTVGGSASYQGAYAQLVSQVGTTAAQINASSQAQNNVVTQVQSAQQSFSGVNLDEEAANLMQYQQAYQAAGKMIQVASTMFNTLLQLGG
jgi:flagellar hook-associated protein 1 FlgK